MERNSSHSFGKSSELAVYRWLRGYGLTAELQPSASKFDLLVNGKRVEIKSTRPVRRGHCTCMSWNFNIHRHNVLDESQVDAYIFRLEGVPDFVAAVHLIVPAPIGKKNVSITIRSLLTKWGSFYNRFSVLEAEYALPNGYKQFADVIRTKSLT